MTMQTTKPNFIFILADDWGWGDLGCFGHQVARTPCLDQIAAEGTRYTQFYSAASVCSPSRAAFMTGQFPAKFRIHGHLASYEENEARGMAQYLDPEALMLPRLLQENGYATAHIGKWHLGGNGSPTPDAYGFDDHRVASNNGKRLLYQGETISFGNLKTRHRSTEAIVDETIRFIEQHKDKPFYVQSWLLDPHSILNPSEEQMEPYAHLTPKGIEGPSPLTVYYSVLSEADRQIGRLVAKLDELGLSENTVLVFTSDNGPEDIEIPTASNGAAGSPGPFRGRKRSLYDGGVRMPCIVRWKGRVPAGKVDNETVWNAVDLLPTFCQLAGIETDHIMGLDGEDVSQAIVGDSGRNTRTKPMMWEFRYPIIGHVINRSPTLAIREGEWKLLINADGTRAELYRQPEEIMELANVAEAHPDVVHALSEKVLAWKATLPEGPVFAAAGSNSYPWPEDMSFMEQTTSIK